MSVAPPPPQWTTVDEGWGRKAVDFATLSEPANCREYVALHHRLDVGEGDRLLDIACGAGLAIELARLRGADCAGIDASPRLVAIARDRNPDADIQVGDMNALPFDDGSFDVVTSFRGIWGTTPAAVGEIHRTLTPGGRIGITVWGHLERSPGIWALVPFTLAAPDKVDNQAAMVSLGRPGAGEQLLARYGFEDIERIDVPFAWEFADPDSYARALASTGPAYEAIRNVGETAFHDAAADLARDQVRDGLPLRATIAVVGYLAHKLDAGCGAGLAPRMATDRGATAVGLDASQPLLDIAHERVPPAELRVGDIQSLPYDNNTFDVVCAFNAVQYAADPPEAVAELARVCRPGGRVAIGVWGDPERCETEALFARLRALAPPQPGAPAPLAISAPGVVEGLLENAGLTPLGGGDVDCPFTYDDPQQAWTGHASAGPLQKMIDTVGTDAVHTVLATVLEADRKPNGQLRQNNTFRYVTATAPNSPGSRCR